MGHGRGAQPGAQAPADAAEECVSQLSVAPVEELSNQALHDAEERLALRRCRICFEGEQGEQGEPGEPLLQLSCSCRGEMGLVHATCANTWFRKRGNGVCELCRDQAYELPPHIVLELANAVQTRQSTLAAQLQQLTMNDQHPRERKAVLLVTLAFTVGLVLSAIIGWLVPSLRKSHMNLPAGLVPVCALIAVVHRPLHNLLPRTITGSWHSVGLLLAAFLVIDGSLLIQTI